MIDLVRRALWVLGAAMIAATVAVGGCSTGSTGSPAPPTSTTSAAETTPTGPVDLTVVQTRLGRAVADADRMTVYIFLQDVPGSGRSNCTGDCLTAWPPVLAGSAEVVGPEITGALGIIETADGESQITLEGWPLYTYAEDSAPGDVAGDAAGEVWYAVGPDGAKLTDSADGPGGY
jgi:predicted lipoprotein with Yx(FWY)xxD motif